jgi:hypothetical protein
VCGLKIPVSGVQFSPCPPFLFGTYVVPTVAPTAARARKSSDPLWLGPLVHAEMGSYPGGCVRTAPPRRLRAFVVPLPLQPQQDRTLALVGLGAVRSGPWPGGRRPHRGRAFRRRSLQNAPLEVAAPGEGLPFVPKQLGRDQRPGNRRTIHADECPRRTVRLRVNGTREQFLPGAGFAGNEDRGIHGRDLRHLRQNPTQCFRRTHDLPTDGSPVDRVSQSEAWRHERSRA